jgi:hypothetical protein
VHEKRVERVGSNASLPPKHLRRNVLTGMEQAPEEQPETSPCSVCGIETEQSSVVALHDGPTLCLDCYSRCFSSDFDLVFAVD